MFFCFLGGVTLRAIRDPVKSGQCYVVTISWLASWMGSLFEAFSHVSASSPVFVRFDVLPRQARSAPRPARAIGLNKIDACTKNDSDPLFEALSQSWVSGTLRPATTEPDILPSQPVITGTGSCDVVIRPTTQSTAPVKRRRTSKRVCADPVPVTPHDMPQGDNLERVGGGGGCDGSRYCR